MSDNEKLSPFLSYGNHRCKINKLELVPGYKPGEKILILKVETQPVKGNFQGWPMDEDKNRRHLGQIGRVKFSQWPYKEAGFTNSANVHITQTEEIMRSLKSLCMEIGKLDWFLEQHEQHKTPELFIEKINKEGLFTDFYFNFCVASRQYLNKKGYVADDLYLPKYKDKQNKPFSRNFDDVMKFNAAEHLQRPKDKNQVDAFDNPAAQGEEDDTPDFLK